MSYNIVREKETRPDILKIKNKKSPLGSDTNCPAFLVMSLRHYSSGFPPVQ